MTARVWHHYACESRVKDYIDRGAITGRTRFIFLNHAQPGLPEKAHDTALWGFLPDTQNHPLHDTIRKQAARDEPLYHFALTIAETDDLHIADTSMFRITRDQPFPSDIEWHSPEGQQLRDAFDATAKSCSLAYWRSLIPFSEYEEGRYEEPEVVSFTPIPLERARCLGVSNEFVPAPVTRYNNSLLRGRAYV